MLYPTELRAHPIMLAHSKYVVNQGEAIGGRSLPRWLAFASSDLAHSSKLHVGTLMDVTQFFHNAMNGAHILLPCGAVGEMVFRAFSLSS